MNAVGFISFFMAFLMFRERLVFKGKGRKIVILVPYFHNYVKTIKALTMLKVPLKSTSIFYMAMIFSIEPS